MSPDNIEAKHAQARFGLALFLSVTLLLATYSALAGFSDALAFVRKDDRALTPPSGKLASLSQLLPSGTSYGFYAPQVSSEFRLRMRLGEAATGIVRDVKIDLGPETSLLVSSLSSTSQNSEVAKTIAASFASYGFTRDRMADSAEVTIEVEIMAPLSEATSRKSEWVTLTKFLFKR